MLPFSPLSPFPFRIPVRNCGLTKTKLNALRTHTCTGSYAKSNIDRQGYRGRGLGLWERGTCAPKSLPRKLKILVNACETKTKAPRWPFSFTKFWWCWKNIHININKKCDIESNSAVNLRNLNEKLLACGYSSCLVTCMCVCEYVCLCYIVIDIAWPSCEAAGKATCNQFIL